MVHPSNHRTGVFLFSCKMIPLSCKPVKPQDWKLPVFFLFSCKPECRADSAKFSLTPTYAPRPRPEKQRSPETVLGMRITARWGVRPSKPALGICDVDKTNDKRTEMTNIGRNVSPTESTGLSGRRSSVVVAIATETLFPLSFLSLLSLPFTNFLSG